MGGNTRFFPLFINLENKIILVVGCGEIGSKRAIKLSSYNGKVIIISPTITNDIEKLVDKNKIMWIKRRFDENDLSFFNPFLVIAATNNRDVNRKIMEYSKNKNILSIISDKREECSAYFPALAENENYIVGITSKMGNHKGVKNLAENIRGLLNKWEKK